MSGSFMSHLSHGRSSPVNLQRQVVAKPKELPLQRYVHQPKIQPAAESSDDFDVRTTRSNTPSLTYGSTKSGASSLSGRPLEESPRGVECEILDFETRSNASIVPWNYSVQGVHVPSGHYLLTQNNCNPPDVESDSDNYSEDSSSSNDDWSGQEDNIEPMVLAAVGNDLELAAYLIPILHQEMSMEISRSVSRKVGIWQSTIASNGGQYLPPLQMMHNGTPNQNSTGSYGQASGSSGPKKRRRSNSSDCDKDLDEDEGDGDEKEDGDGDGDGGEKPNKLPGKTGQLRLACPFHKLDPKKYAIQYGAQDSHKKTDYKSCSGPGFKNIQRLKEHLRRKHCPVQCDRCYVVFHGPDRPACMLQLVKHRQTPVPCERGDESLKEGISDAQWESLDGKRGRKGSQEKEPVGKWFEVWRALFPGTNEPKTPWYEESSAQMSRVSGLPQSEQFLRHFELVLNQKQRDMDLPPGIRERIVTAADTAFRLWLNLSVKATSTDSTSSRTHSHKYPSMMGGSSTHLSSQPSYFRYMQSQSSGTDNRSRASSNSFYQPHQPVLLGQSTRQAVQAPQGPQFNVPWSLTPTSPSYHLGNMGGTMAERALSFAGYQLDGRSPGIHEAPVFQQPLQDWTQSQGVFQAQARAFPLHPTFTVPTTVSGETLSSPLMEDSMDTMNDLTDPITYE